MISRAVVLRRYPMLTPNPNDVGLVKVNVGGCIEGQILIKLLYLSVDPYMRNRMRPEGSSYIGPFELQKSLVSMGIGEVIESQSANFKANDIVIGMLPWQDFSIINEKDIKHIQSSSLPMTAQLGILGYPGLTAYVGIHHFVKLSPAQTVFVSGAAGSVGSLAGQLAKLKGCTVVGCASTDEKVACLLNEFNFDSAFNYQNYQGDYNLAFKKYCPNGIDIDFENVGGPILEAAIENINQQATIILCGAISQYNTINPRKGPSNFAKMTDKKAKLIGYIVTDYDHIFPEFECYIYQKIQDGTINYRETIIEGLENAWNGFIGLFSGMNIGKMLIKC